MTAPDVSTDARVALAWHDVTCPEAEDCRDRQLHAASAPVANGGILAAFLARLGALAPAATDVSTDTVCICGHPLTNHWQTGKRLCMACPDGGCPDFTPRPAAPDVDTDTGALREEFRRLLFWGVDTGKANEAADALLALPALRDLIAERDQAVAAVRRVRELAKDLNTDARSMWAAAEAHESETDEMVGDTYFEVSKRIRLALDGDQ